MNYIEAYKEARAGKIVRQMPSMCKAKVNHLGYFVWTSCGNPVNQHAGTICAEWELATEPPLPPKRYSFPEAYVMMKKGKWMRRIASPHWEFSAVNDTWFHRPANGQSSVVNGYDPELIMFSSKDIDGQWEEVQP